MKYLQRKFALLFVLPAVMMLAGCGGGGGSPGDENDPATTSDVEQMEGETGEV